MAEAAPSTVLLKLEKLRSDTKDLLLATQTLQDDGLSTFLYIYLDALNRLLNRLDPTPHANARPVS